MPFDEEEFQLESNGVKFWPKDIGENYGTLSIEAEAMFGLDLRDRDSAEIGFTSANYLRQAHPSKMNTGAEVIQLTDEIVFQTAITDVEDLESHVRVRADDIRTGEHQIYSGRRLVLALGGIESNRLILNSKTLMAGVSAPELVGSGYSPHLNFVGGLMRPSQKILASLKIQSQNLSQFYFTPTRKTSFTDSIKVTLPLVKKDLIGYWNSPKRFLKTGYPLDRGVRLINVAAGHRPTQYSRIQLAERSDSLGRKGVEIIHSVPDQDKKAVLSKVREMIQELSGGDFSFAEGVELGKISRGKSHHLGGLRIMNAKGEGVVDENLRLDGTNNVFLVTSAVFPTFSHANPTLTICALAIRLARHLES